MNKLIVKLVKTQLLVIVVVGNQINFIVFHGDATEANLSTKCEKQAYKLIIEGEFVF